MKLTSCLMKKMEVKAHLSKLEQYTSLLKGSPSMSMQVGESVANVMLFCLLFVSSSTLAMRSDFMVLILADSHQIHQQHNIT